MELSLGIGPARIACTQAQQSSFGQYQLFAAAIGLIRHDGYEPVLLERPDVASHGGAVHDHLGSKSIDSHGPVAPKALKNGELGRPPPDVREKPIVKLRDVQRRLPDGKAVTIVQFRQPGSCAHPTGIVEALFLGHISVLRSAETHPRG